MKVLVKTTFIKKIFFIPLFLFFCTAINAQNSFGVRVAYNNTTVSNPSGNARIRDLNRFQAGAFGQLTIYKEFFLKGNLIYNQKGNFYDDTHVIADAGKSVTMKLNYIETSIDIGYTIKLIEKQRIQMALGPYLAFGLNGTEKGYGETIAGPFNINRKVVFNNTKDYNGTNLQMKPLEAGLNFNVGYQYLKYGAFINYGLGLTNRDKWGEFFNRVASVGVSYSFK
jgi:hypothetical protein